MVVSEEIEALEALARFNEGFEAGYGADGVTARAADLVRALLDAEAEVRFVASGTAANALTLAALAAPHEAFLAHEHAHAAASAAHGKGDHLTGHELSKKALEHSMNAHRHSEEMLEEMKVSRKA